MDSRCIDGKDHNFGAIEIVIPDTEEMKDKMSPDLYEKVKAGKAFFIPFNTPQSQTCKICGYKKDVNLFAFKIGETTPQDIVDALGEPDEVRGNLDVAPKGNPVRDN